MSLIGTGLALALLALLVLGLWWAWRHPFVGLGLLVAGMAFHSFALMVVLRLGTPYVLVRAFQGWKEILIVVLTLIALAAHHRVPAVYPFRYFATSGGLMSYGTDVAEVFRRAAAYVDHILRGTSPGDLPVQAPTKYDLVINLKTARALGLTVPEKLLAIADEVIE